MFKNKERKQSHLTILSHIYSVIDSCETRLQLENTFNWAKVILKNHICFGIYDYGTLSSTFSKMTQNYLFAVSCVEAKYKIKIFDLKNDI